MLLKSKMVDAKATQRRLYDSIVTKQLDKLEAAARGASVTDNVSFSCGKIVLSAGAYSWVLHRACSAGELRLFKCYDVPNAL